MSETIDFQEWADGDRLANNIAMRFVEWESRRSGWKQIVKELRNYIFATDTRTTSMGNLPWKNSVHIPKICQIRDVLYANYIAALYPNDNAITWEGDDESSQTKEKRNVITAYMRNKLRQSKFNVELNKCILDFIDYGNCFATIEYRNQKVKNENSGETHQVYVGPRLVRISPEDIVFDPTAARFEDTPKIIRSLMTLGDLRAMIEDNPEKAYLEDVFKKVTALRKKATTSMGQVDKNSQFEVDGFSSWEEYLNSDTVELLDFYGDIYDKDEDKLYRNHCITVVDRCYIIRKVELNNWFGKAPFFHAGWRVRPDNLYAMGPLDNIVGMQYRINHLENTKADGMDMIVQPVLKIKGAVEHFNYGPNERIYVSEEGDVEFMHPDSTILHLDTQIAMYEQKMEMMAGAPAESTGFRTPGEKTAYEVQIMDQARNKVFINKTAYFEEVFMEPALNAMFEAARRNIGLAETIRVEDEDFNFDSFLTVTRDDIVAVGKLRPIGARRFARNANMLQNLTQLSASALYQDPSVNVHFSGKRMADLIETLLGFEHYDLVEDNIRVMESIETQEMQSTGQQILMDKGTPANQIPGAPPGPQGSQAAQPATMAMPPQ
jgi:hypothetical protein